MLMFLIISSVSYLLHLHRVLSRVGTASALGHLVILASEGGGLLHAQASHFAAVHHHPFIKTGRRLVVIITCS